MTHTARDILRVLRGVQAGAEDGALGLVAGTTGVGKSTAMWQFKRENPEIVIYRAGAGEGSAWGAALALCNILGLPVPNCRDLASARRAIAKALSLKSMLVVNEAQGLVKVNAKGKERLAGVRMAEVPGRGRRIRDRIHRRLVVASASDRSWPTLAARPGQQGGDHGCEARRCCGNRRPVGLFGP